MNTSTVTREAMDRLISDLRSVIRDGQEVLKAGAGDLSDKGKEARARLEEAIQRARANCEQYEGRAAETVRFADETIRDHPYTSIGAAFGIGVLLGVLINRR